MQDMACMVVRAIFVRISEMAEYELYHILELYPNRWARIYENDIHIDLVKMV